MSSLISVNSLIKDLNLFFSQKSGLLSTLSSLAVGFCPVGYCQVGFFPSGLLSQWAFVRSPFISMLYLDLYVLGDDALIS